MKGQQSSSSPKLSYWSGYNGQGSLWQGIRHCNILIENIHNVVDMSEEEKNAWAAEAKFLKAYYHFLLLTYYGPIPIVDENIPISASDQDVRVKRKPIDEVFQYIVSTIDEAIIDLPFEMIEVDKVSLNIFDVAGRKVASLINNDVMTPGHHKISWNPGLLPSGVYLVELVTGVKSFNQKITYIK